MPIDYKNYPDNWKDIRNDILIRAKNCCEGSPRYPNCNVPNYNPHPVTGSKVILTIAHLDQNRNNNNYKNLRALCQRCHLTHDAIQHALNRKYGREWKYTIGKLF